jgi:UDP-N-acetylglucosamine 2-epimerase (non-hydrolysing)
MLSQRRGRGLFRTADRKVLITLHRRENQGDTMRYLAQTAAGLVRRGNVEVVLPVHHNPAVREVLVPELGQVDGVRLTGPLCYDDFIATLSASDLVLTDSGGVQEEAVALGKPVLVLRRTTERPEAIELGAAELVGVDARAVYARAMDLLTGRGCPLASRPSDVFGQGDAAVRIVERLARDLTEKPRRALDVHEMQSKDHERSLPQSASRLEEEAVG